MQLKKTHFFWLGPPHSAGSCTAEALKKCQPLLQPAEKCLFSSGLTLQAEWGSGGNQRLITHWADVHSQQKAHLGVSTPFTSSSRPSSVLLGANVAHGHKLFNDLRSDLLSPFCRDIKSAEGMAIKLATCEKPHWDSSSSSSLLIASKSGC